MTRCDAERGVETGGVAATGGCLPGVGVAIMVFGVAWEGGTWGGKA